MGAWIVPLHHQSHPVLTYPFLARTPWLYGVTHQAKPQHFGQVSTTLGFVSRQPNMRYQDWDVLLFPSESRVPVQEFDTKCFALDQSQCKKRHMPILTRSANASADVRISTFQAAPETNPNTFESMTLVPSMTCFIASLEHGTSFRISVHSWQKPVSSSILRVYKTPEEKTAFEARVYVDGVLQRYATPELSPFWTTWLTNLSVASAYSIKRMHGRKSLVGSTVPKPSRC